MEQEIQDFNNTLLNLYLNNLEFLKKEHPNVFEKVNNLSEKINNDEYQEKYSLEYKQEGYFDILNLDTNEFIYGFNSYEEADKRSQKTDFTKKHSLDLLRIDSNKKLALMSSLGTALPLVNFLNNKIDFENITFSKIFKFVFIGVGVGVHLHEVYKKMDSMNTLIIEPNLEIFRLSLFTIDYSIFTQGNKQLFLSIDDSQLDRERVINSFTQYHSYMNYNIKHHLFWIDYEYLLNELIDYYSHNFSAAFSYNTVLTVFARTINFMHQEFKFLKHSLVKDKNPLENKKVLIIGAGPSLDKQIDWIYKNQKKFVIVCVDNMTIKLEKHSIVPDIVVSIDPADVVQKFFNTKDKDFLKNSSIILLSQQHKEVIEKIKHLNFYFSQVLPISEEINYSFSLPNVGTFGFALSIFLGSKELYLVGNDSALDPNSGKAYAISETGHNQDALLKGEESKNKETVSSNDIIEVKGNFGGVAKSTRKLITFRNDYESFIHAYKDEESFEAYNLSDTGAYIEGIKPLRITDIDTSNFEDKKGDLNTQIKEVSIIVKDLNFTNDIKILNSLIHRVEKFKKVKISSKNDFLEKKLDIMIWILEQKKKMDYSIFGNIFLKFTDLIDIYINFALNTKQNELQGKEFLMEVKNYWANALVALLKDLKKATREDIDDK